MSMMWVGIGSAVLGAGASLYGANKQAGASKDAANQNAALQDKQNQAAWANYLMTRGLNPNGAVTGQLPTNPQAINTRLPLWATANFAAPGTKSRWVKKGTVPTAGTLATTSYTPAPVAPVSAGEMAGASGNGSGGKQGIADILDPLNLAIGNNRNNFFDPLGIF